MKYDSFTLAKNYCIRLDKGDEVIGSLTAFCMQHKISSGSFFAIGATNNITVGSFDLKTKKYIDKTIKMPLEILSLVGNVSLMNKKPLVHAHIVVGKEHFETIGGHVKSCIISLTCEIYLQTHNKRISRVQNTELGISYLDLSKR